MPLFALPGEYGIGDMGRSARQFVDFLAETKQRVWQLLPLATMMGDSPYQARHAASGEPLYLDPEDFLARGWVTGKELEEAKAPAGPVDYDKVRARKHRLYRIAYQRGFEEKQHEVEEAYALWPWLAVYVQSLGGRPEDARDDLRNYHGFLQVIWREQWAALRAYAHEREVAMMGDLPIYPAPGGAELEERPDLFWLDESGRPTKVAGVPPDVFAKEGQLWGNPLYCWEAHQREEYRWWARRLAIQLELYDLLRLDHFRAFCDYWAVPSEHAVASQGHWETGPGMAFFEAMEKSLGKVAWVAEDLGLLHQGVLDLRDEAGIPGMAILQFAFDGDDSLYLPHHIHENQLAYTGTHDNPTSLEWYEKADSMVKKRLVVYGGIEAKDMPWGLVRLALTSSAVGAIIPMGDWLGLGKEGRINVPGVAKGQWRWRMKSEDYERIDRERICQLVEVTHRDQPW